MMKWLILTAMLALVACSDDDNATPQDNNRGVRDMGADTAPNNANNANNVNNANNLNNVNNDVDMGVDMDVEPCRALAPADRVRKLVVSKPYADDGMERPEWAIYDVSQQGDLTDTGETFNMGVATMGEVKFTPDGEWGFAPQKDGSVGVFRISGTGIPEVFNPRFTGEFYTSSLEMAPDGSALYIIETGFRNVGGAIHRVNIDCTTGELTYDGVFAEAKLAKGISFLSDGRAVVAARDILDDETPADVHIVDFFDATRLSSAPVFTDDMQIVVSLAVSPDERFAFLGDANFFGMNRLGVASINGDTVASAQVIEDVPDPQDIVVSPFNDVVLVLSSMDDSIRVFDLDSQAAQPLTYRGPLQASSATLLPGNAVMIERGALNGTVFVTENTSIRTLEFGGNGMVTDVAETSTGDSLTGIPGAIGIQP